MKKSIIGVIVGTLILGAVESTALAQNANEKVKFNDLPKAVQKNLRSKKEHINRIEEFTYNGKTVYEVRLDSSESKDFIYLDANGKRMNDKAMRDQRRAERKENKNNSTASVPSEHFDKPLAATQKVDFNSTPEAVKSTIRDMADGNRVEDAERGTLDGRTVYQIAYKKNGIHNEVRVGEDGSVMQHIAGTNITFPGSLSINDVPEAVQRSIRKQVGSGEVNDIDKNTVDGKTVYEVGFKRESGGQQHELRIAEDGTVLGEAAGANK